MHDVSIDFEEGSLHAVTGPTRSGKTLLLHLLGLLDEPDFGRVELFGEAASPAPEEVRRGIRNSVFGYVFANPCLLRNFTVAENVAMPLFRVSAADEYIAQRRVAELLERFAVAEYANDPADVVPADVQMLAALARAIVHRPRVLLLLEPGRPEVLTRAVRDLVDDLHITTVWSGRPGTWSAAADFETRLDQGCVVASETAAP